MPRKRGWRYFSVEAAPFTGFAERETFTNFDFAPSSSTSFAINDAATLSARSGQQRLSAESRLRTVEVSTRLIIFPVRSSATLPGLSSAKS